MIPTQKRKFHLYFNDKLAQLVSLTDLEQNFRGADK